MIEKSMQILIGALLIVFLGAISKIRANLAGFSRHKLIVEAENSSENVRNKLLKITKHPTRYMLSIVIAQVVVSVASYIIFFGRYSFNNPLGIFLRVSWLFGITIQLYLPRYTVNIDELKKQIPMIVCIRNIFWIPVWIVEKTFPDRRNKEHDSWSQIVEQIESGHSTGNLDSDDFEMIDGVISMHKKMAKEIMVPRIDVFMVDITNDNERNIENIIENNYSRVPVYHETRDNIVGIVYIKNLVKAARKKGFNRVTIRQVMQEAFFVPETMMIDELLYQMKLTKNQMAILIDEYGGIVGLVTLEDLLEEIVGDIEDETDEPNVLMRKINNEQFLVKGKMTIDDFNDEFGTKISQENADTLAGYMITTLGIIPDRKQKINLKTDEGIVFETEKIVDDTRIDSIKVTLPPKFLQFFKQKEEQRAELKEKMQN